jgi:hypothetical protein
VPFKQPELVRYHATVRETIDRLDSLIADILFKGAAGVILILVGPWWAFGSATGNQAKLVADWFGLLLFLSSTFAIFIAVYTFLAVELYSHLLASAVTVGKAVESAIFKDDTECWLTTEMDKHLLAGGNWGGILYIVLPIVLYFGAVAGSFLYLLLWLASPNEPASCLARAWCWYPILLLLLLGSLLVWRAFTLRK